MKANLEEFQISDENDLERTTDVIGGVLVTYARSAPYSEWILINTQYCFPISEAPNIFPPEKSLTRIRWTNPEFLSDAFFENTKAPRRMLNVSNSVIFPSRPNLFGYLMPGIS
jgi:hypothetical protein